MSGAVPGDARPAPGTAPPPLPEGKVDPQVLAPLLPPAPPSRPAF